MVTCSRMQLETLGRKWELEDWKPNPKYLKRMPGLRCKPVSLKSAFNLLIASLPEPRSQKLHQTSITFMVTANFSLLLQDTNNFIDPRYMCETFSSRTLQMWSLTTKNWLKI